MRTELFIKAEQTQILSQKMILSNEILQMGVQELCEKLGEIFLENPVVDLNQPSPEEERMAKYQWLESLSSRNRDTYMHESRDEEEGNDDWKFKQNDEESLQDYLWSQVSLKELSGKDEEIISYLMESLDDKGYLDEPSESVAERFGEPVEQIEKIISNLQMLEPAGVFARNLGECLLLQLQRNKADTPEAEEIVREHLELLAGNKIPAIAKKVHLSVEETAEICQRIRNLNPRPGSHFSSREQLSYLIPDVTVVKFADRFEILLNESTYPTIEINDYYRKMSIQSDSAQVHDYLREKLRQAEWIRTCMEQRGRTIMNVTKTILAMQSEFFEKGPSYLQPLKQSDVAEMIGIHESTVSRAVRQKYLQCSWGIYPMNYFFSRGISEEKGRGGKAISVQEVKSALTEIVREENKKKPFSDRLLAEKLEEKGFTISRRTVAKYREELGIPDAGGRKVFL